MVLRKIKEPTGCVYLRARLAFLLALLTLSLPTPVFPDANKLTAPQLIALANSNSPVLLEAINASMDAKDLRSGTAWLGHGPEFFFAAEAASKPTLIIDDAPGPQMQHVANSHLWYAPARIAELGKLHSFYYLVDGAKFGGLLDLPAFTPDSYQQPGAPSGTLSEKLATQARFMTE